MLFFSGKTVQAQEIPKYVMGRAGYQPELQEQGIEAWADSKTKTNTKAVSYAWNKVNGKFYNAEGKVIPGAITRGVDVSEWQEAINWNKVKTSNVDFAFIRCGYSYPKGSGTAYVEDKQFRNNMQGINQAGIPAGVYIYSQAMTVQQAREDAERIINAVQGYTISYPLVLDMETDAQAALGKNLITKMMRAFCEEIEEAGYYPMIYSNLYWYTSKYSPDKLTDYDMWIAAYQDSSTGLGSSCRHTIWQATSGTTYLGLLSTVGMINGISDHNSVDINFGYVDYTKKITPRTYRRTDTENTQKEGWVQEDGATYYCQNNTRVTGLKRIDGKRYYFANKATSTREKGALIRDTLLKINKKFYYLDEDGVLKENGWLTYKGHDYYFKNGTALLGEQKIGNKYYYFYLTKGYKATNVKGELNGNIYYFTKDGSRYQGGWLKLKISGRVYTYYFSKSTGIALRGWNRVDGKKYYFLNNTNPVGARAESRVIKSKGIIYKFDANGECQVIKPSK
ncbi:MAG: GH25 family lysozyme [Eubacteriales bacterium]|nr:GH25 family lysozyme [Eubacteriales bacterium]